MFGAMEIDHTYCSTSGNLIASHIYHTDRKQSYPFFHEGGYECDNRGFDTNFTSNDDMSSPCFEVGISSINLSRLPLLQIENTDESQPLRFTQ
jgi:hypothetical protein